MKTLYLSDLDGTLLGVGDRVSKPGAAVINGMIRRGMMFSYATARSLNSAEKAVRGLDLKLPVIIYNGAFIADPQTKKRYVSHLLSRHSILSIVEMLTNMTLYHLVYAYVDGKERVSWLSGGENEGLRHYLLTRAGDTRLREVFSQRDLFAGEIFYLTCIGTRLKLAPIYGELAEDRRYRCLLQCERPGEYWLEIMPRDASKAIAAQKLKQMTDCGRLVAFGDGLNDLELFAIADEAYATADAVPELKAAATGIIGSCKDDGVARWLKEHTDRALGHE